jgi:hypothetical protein
VLLEAAAMALLHGGNDALGHPLHQIDVRVALGQDLAVVLRAVEHLVGGRGRVQWEGRGGHQQ